MKRWFFVVVLGLGGLGMLLESTEACGPVGKQVADVVVKKLLAECVAENAHLGDAELQTECRFAEDLWPIVRDLVAAQKRGMAKAAAARDAGRD